MSNKKQIIIITIMGILTLGISFLFVDFATHKWNEWLNQILINIALIFLTVVVLNWIWDLLGGEPMEKLITKLNSSVNLLAHSKDSGLVDFSDVSGGYATHPEWMKKLTSAKREIDLMGYSLRSWTYGENFVDEIIKLAQKGVKIRVMFMDGDNANFEAFINTSISSHSFDSVKKDIESFQRVFDEINNKLTDNKPTFIKVKQGIITGQFCRIDSEIYVIPYLYSVNTSESPLFVIEGENTKLYNKYLKEFKSLWDKNQI